MRRNILIAVFASAAAFAPWDGDACYGQARYRPSTPTVSPYLNLGRFDGGAVPNYYSLVRPQLRQQDLSHQIRQLQELQSTVIGRLPINPEQSLMPTGKASRFRTTERLGARNSPYLNTFRYYPDPGVIRRR